jgi:hypothetical protein
VVKSTNHFMAAFGPIAQKVIYVETDAPLNRNYRQIPYARVNRPIWPLDEVTTPGLVIWRFGPGLARILHVDTKQRCIGALREVDHVSSLNARIRSIASLACR